MTGEPETTRTVMLRRSVTAPPDRVYRAWLDPEVMRTWYAPAGYRVGSVAVDERVGGRISVQHLDNDGRDVGGNESVIEELVPGRRIVLRFRFVGPGAEVAEQPETRLSVTFTPVEGGTLVELVHERLRDLRDVHPDIADGVDAGWRSALDHLAAALDGRNPNPHDKTGKDPA